MMQDISVKKACALTLLPSLVMTVMYYWVGSRFLPRYFHWTDYETIRMTYSRKVLIVSVVSFIP